MNAEKEVPRKEAAGGVSNGLRAVGSHVAELHDVLNSIRALACILEHDRSKAVELSIAIKQLANRGLDMANEVDVCVEQAGEMLQ